MSENKLIFSFDLGTGSIGECVRKGKEVKHLTSLLLPSEFASTKNQAVRRRMIRTREAHKAREQWWIKQAKEAGIEVLETRQPSLDRLDIKADDRMLKEFPADGDRTIYTSCLLRIALLQGRKLESWQIFKAIWSAIQHRGYDTALPWASKEIKRRDSKKEGEEDGEMIPKEETKEKEDEAKNKEQVQEYMQYCMKNFGNNKEYWYPCFYEAHKMGVWTIDHPTDLSGKIGTNPQPFRGRVAPRSLVIEELRALLGQAAKQFPKLKGKEEYIIFGPAQEPYGSFKKPEYRAFRGKAWDWQGLLGQKIPRFDNRIIDKCCLIPRLNVCKANDMLHREFVFLSKLKNMRYIKDSNTSTSLTQEEINNTYEIFKSRLGDQEKLPSQHTITKSMWGKYVKEKLNGSVNPAFLLVEGPRVGGRARFCRPALRILKEILLSGETPVKLHARMVEKNKIENPQQQPNKGLLQSDFDFLLRMPPAWESFSIPDERELDHTLNKEQRLEEIAKIIRDVRNPVVRHRLGVFVKRLNELTLQQGKPDEIVIEFIREDFMGDKQKREYEAFMRNNRKRRDLAAQKLKDINAHGKDALTKILLFEEQNGMDLYGIQKLSLSQLDSYEIDHIVPRAHGGPDTFFNKVLTTHENNKDKSCRTPHEWLFPTDRWEGYLKAVESNSMLSLKKKLLLTASDISQLVERLSNIAETAYIAKLTQRIAALYYGWDWQTAGSQRKIKIVAGGQTAQLRRKYGLDRLLHPEMSDEEWTALLGNGTISEKNRNNKKHHALDALVLSMTPELKLNLKTKEDDLPAWFQKNYCAKELEKVIPRNIAFEKPALADTIYGMRSRKEKEGIRYYMVKRTSFHEYFKDFKKAKSKFDSLFDFNLRNILVLKYNSISSQEEWEDFIKRFTYAGTSPKKVFIIENKKGAKALSELKHFKEINRRQYFTRKKEHKGYIVYCDENSKWQAEPVYVYESIYNKMKMLMGMKGKGKLFRSGMLVRVKSDCNKGTKNPIEAGVYFLNSIQNGRSAVLTSGNNSKESLTVALQTLMEDGEMEIFNK